MLVQLNSGPFPDLLTEVDNGIGGWVAVTYTNAATLEQPDGSRPHMPMPVHMVTSVHEDDNIRAGNTWTYNYSGR